MYEKPRVNVRWSEVQLLRLRAAFHTSPLFKFTHVKPVKVYVRTHVKITRETTVIRVRSRANTIKDVAKANSMKSQDSDSQVRKQQTLNRKSLKTAESLISAKDK